MSSRGVVYSCTIGMIHFTTESSIELSIEAQLSILLKYKMVGYGPCLGESSIGFTIEPGF